MKKIVSLLAIVLLATLGFGQAKTLPSANIKTLEGQVMNVQELGKTGKITFISFWATWCSPCKKELDAIAEYYDEWKEKYGLEVVAISVDDARSQAKVAPMVAEKGWTYRILLDAMKEFSTAANVASVPFSMLLDKNGNIVFEHTGYAPGDEVDLEEKIKELVAAGN